MSKKFKDVYIGFARNCLDYQHNDGSMPAGCNGLYRDPETPVRNTSHFLISFVRAWELSGEDIFRNAAQNCLNFLLSTSQYRSGYTFHHRNKEGKDKCNGLIGTAWNIESLIYAHDKLGSKDAKALALELFLLHPFDEDECVWNRVEPDGEILTYDTTFNHQLWFAACSSKLGKDIQLVDNRISSFIGRLNFNWASSPGGRVIHPLWTRRIRWRERVKRVIKPSYRRDFLLKEVGYHAFNLYAFVLLRNSEFALPRTISKRIDNATKYVDSREFNKLISRSKYGFPYNPPGWEIPVALTHLAESDPKVCQKWVQMQFDHSFDVDQNEFSKNVTDVSTHNARAYEAALLPDSVFDLQIII